MLSQQKKLKEKNIFELGRQNVADKLDCDLAIEHTLETVINFILLIYSPVRGTEDPPFMHTTLVSPFRTFTNLPDLYQTLKPQLRNSFASARGHLHQLS